MRERGRLGSKERGFPVEMEQKSHEGRYEGVKGI